MTQPGNRRAWALAQLGRTLGGRYRLEALRGAGGMGAVYEATHLHVGRAVAVKLLFPPDESSASSAPSAADTLREEARHAASASCSGVVEVTDFDFDDGAAFLVMELLEGRSLREQLSSGALSAREARPILSAVLSALEAVHGQGLVHGDLKPSNVFLCASGETKLLDFGVARAMATGVGQRLQGTPAYMAPEQLDGSSGAAIDLYATGALAYEALSGRRPYAGLERGEVLEALASEAPRPLSRIDASLPAPLRRWVERAMAREPSARFADARAMREALDAIELRAPEETLDAPVSLGRQSAAHASSDEAEPEELQHEELLHEEAQREELQHEEAQREDTPAEDASDHDALRAFRGALGRHTGDGASVAVDDDEPDAVDEAGDDDASEAEPGEAEVDAEPARRSEPPPRRTPWIVGGLLGALILGAFAWAAFPPPRWSMPEPPPPGVQAAAPAPESTPPAAVHAVDEPAPPDRAAPIAADIGDSVLAPFGPRFVFPATVVERSGDVARVVFADGDVASVPVIDLLADTIAPGACLLRRERGQRRGHRACVVQRVRHAVLVTVEGDSSRWTSLMHLFADPSASRTGLAAYEPPEASGTEPGARVLANFRRRGRDFVGVVVERDEEDQALVVYFDGDGERLEAEHVRAFDLEVGSSVTAAPRRTSVVDPDVGAATVERAIGDALYLRLEDGRGAWVALGQVRVERP